MTNFEKIKSDIKNMETAEQLVDSQYIYAGFHCGHCEYDGKCRQEVICSEQYLKWLESEAKQ